MKRISAFLLACFFCVALLSCEKNRPTQVPQSGQDAEEQSEKDNDNSENNNQSGTMVLNITAGGKTMTATLADNDTARELAEKLKSASVTVRMKANGFEHYGPLGFSLTNHDRHVTAVTGDIMLYNSDNICIFYGNNSWSYTPLGKVDGVSADELKAFFGKGDISVTFSMGQ